MNEDVWNALEYKAAATTLEEQQRIYWQQLLQSEIDRMKGMQH